MKPANNGRINTDNTYIIVNLKPITLAWKINLVNETKPYEANIVMIVEALAPIFMKEASNGITP